VHRLRFCIHTLRAQVPAEDVQTPKKKRSQSEKVGRLKYIIQKRKDQDCRLDRIECILRTLEKGLGDFLNIPKDYIFLVTCQDEIDQAIVELLFAAGSAGLTTSQIAEKLQRYRVKRFFCFG
jgi:hypothetical protein